jgi:hypothetical protein
MASRYERIRDLIDAATHVGQMETVSAQMFAGSRYGELTGEEWDELADLARHKRHQLRLGGSNG